MMHRIAIYGFVVISLLSMPMLTCGDSSCGNEAECALCWGTAGNLDTINSGIYVSGEATTYSSVRQLYSFSGFGWQYESPFTMVLGGTRQSAQAWVDSELQFGNITYNYSRVSLSEPIRSVNNETLGYEDENADFFTCPVGQALIALFHDTTVSPSLEQLSWGYYCDELLCSTVEDKCTWVYTNTSADPDTGDGISTICAGQWTRVVSGVCINTNLNTSRCMHDGDAHYLAIKCCTLDQKRDQCTVFRDYLHDPEERTIDLVSESADDFNVTCQDADGTKTFINKIIINGTYLDYTCSHDIMRTTIHGFTTHTLNDLSQSFTCPVGTALHQWMYTHATQTYTFVCGYLTWHDEGVSCGEIIEPLGFYPDQYLPYNTGCGPYIMCGIHFADVDDFKYRCCGTDLVDTTSTTYEITTHLHTRTTTTTLTTTTHTDIADTNGCNATLTCLPEPTGTWPAFTDCYNLTNYSAQWPCKIECTMTSACVILPLLTDAMFYNAHISELYIIGSAGGLDEISGVGDAVFAHTDDMTKLRVPPWDNTTEPPPYAYNNWYHAACSRLLTPFQLNFIDEINVTDCVTTTTTTTTKTTTTLTTTITEPNNCTGITCPEECSRISDVRGNTIGYNNIYDYDCSDTLTLGACCTTVSVCARGTCVGSWMFYNMSSLEELVLLASNDTLNEHFDYIGPFALSNLTLRTIYVDPVKNGYKNVNRQAYLDNNCHNDPAHASDMDNGAHVSYTCYAVPTTTTTATNATSTTTPTPSTGLPATTTEKSGGGGSGSKRISDTEMITIIFGAIVGVLFVAAAVTLLCFTSKGITAERSAFDSSKYVQFKPTASYFGSGYEKVSQNARPNPMQKWNVYVDTF